VLAYSRANNLAEHTLDEHLCHTMGKVIWWDQPGSAGMKWDGLSRGTSSSVRSGLSFLTGDSPRLRRCSGELLQWMLSVT
jgi:hypothetical protein